MNLKIKLILPLCFLLISSCYKEKDFSNVNIDPASVILNLKPYRNVLLATGADTTMVTVELPVDARDSLTTVSYLATTGTFIETAKNTASVKAVVRRVAGVQKRLAVVTYQTGISTGTTTITVRVGDYVRTFDLTVNTNYADAIKLTPSALSLKADPAAEMTLTVNLTSTKGLVTPGQPVSLAIRDAANVDKGTFRVKNDKSDGAGNCTFTYAIMPDTAYRGKLTVTAKAIVNNMALPDETTTIYIIK